MLSFEVMVRSIVNFTDSPVKSSPLWNLTPLRSLNSHVFGFRFRHDSARSGLISMVCGIAREQALAHQVDDRAAQHRAELVRIDRLRRDGKPMVSVGLRA